MVSKKSGLVITVLGVLSFLFSVTYVSSCTKPLEDNPWSCNYVVCNNGGKCDSGKCVCPVGYDGSDCSNKIVAKYHGYWQVSATNIGSDSANNINDVMNYTLHLKESATMTTFIMNNFQNNQYYNNILCKMDSANSNDFVIDTTLAQNMYYDHYRIRGGWGKLYARDSIWARVYIRSINSTVNWQNDTFNLLMHRL